MSTSRRQSKMLKGGFGRRATAVKLETMIMKPPSLPPTPETENLAVNPICNTANTLNNTLDLEVSVFGTRQPSRLNTVEAAPTLKRPPFTPAFNPVMEIRAITDKMSRAVHEMDSLYGGTEDDELLSDIIDQTDNLASGQLKSQLKIFISKYKEVSEDIGNKANERTEILSSLSDWFSATQLSPTRLSKIEDGHMREVRDCIAKTKMKFDKLRSLQAEMEKGKERGSRTDYLARKSNMLIDEALQGFKDCQKVVQEKSDETKEKKQDQMTEIWSSAAGEIMDMFNKVRTEGDSALGDLKGKMDQVSSMVNHYQDQLILMKEQVKQLQAADTKWQEDNGILTESNAYLEERIEKFRNELTKTRKLLQKHEAAPAVQDWESESHADVNPENAERVVVIVKETTKNISGAQRIKKLQTEARELKDKLKSQEEVLVSKYNDIVERENIIRTKEGQLDSLNEEFGKTTNKLQAKAQEIKDLKSSLRSLGEKLKGKDYEIYQQFKESNKIDEEEDDGEEELKCSDSSLHLDCNRKIAELERQLAQVMKSDLRRILPKITEGESDMEDLITENGDVGDIKKKMHDQIIEEEADIVNFTKWARTMLEQKKNTIFQTNNHLKNNVINTAGVKSGQGTHKTLDKLNRAQDAFQNKMQKNYGMMERALNMIRSAHSTSMETVTNQLDIFEKMASLDSDDRQSNTNNGRSLTTDDVGIKAPLPAIAAMKSKSDVSYDKDKSTSYIGDLAHSASEPENGKPLRPFNMNDDESMTEHLKDFFLRKKKVKPLLPSFQQEQKKLQKILDQVEGRHRRKSITSWTLRQAAILKPPNALGGSWKDVEGLMDEYTDCTLIDLEETCDELQPKRRTDEKPETITPHNSELDLTNKTDQYTDELDHALDIPTGLIFAGIWNPLTSVMPSEENEPDDNSFSGQMTTESDNT